MRLNKKIYENNCDDQNNMELISKVSGEEESEFKFNTKKTLFKIKFREIYVNTNILVLHIYFT